MLQREQAAGGAARLGALDLPAALPPPITVEYCLASFRPPGRSLDEYNRLLHVVIVGGGPTGVEVRTLAAGNPCC